MYLEKIFKTALLTLFIIKSLSNDNVQSKLYIFI